MIAGIVVSAFKSTTVLFGAFFSVACFFFNGLECFLCFFSQGECFFSGGQQHRENREFGYHFFHRGKTQEI